MAEHIRKTDRRTERTRRLLRDALMELIVEKGGYDAVSIQDITDRADVARTTFYLHYRDKDELLLTGMAEMYDEIVKLYHPLGSAEIRRDGISEDRIDTSDYEHVSRYADFYRIMLSNKGSLAFLLGILRYLQTMTTSDILCPLEPDEAAPRLPIGLIANMLAWSEAGAMDWWLREGKQYSAKEMAQMQYYWCTFGLAWALRLNVQPPDITITQNWGVQR